MGKPMREISSRHKMPQNLKVVAVAKEGTAAASLLNTVAKDDPKAAGWLRTMLFGDRIVRVPVVAQRALKRKDRLPHPQVPFASPAAAKKTTS